MNEQRYHIEKFLGKGGVGETFLVSDTAQEGRLAVLKRVPKGAFPLKIDSLRREFVHLSRLAHPNIARVLDFGQDGRFYFFIEEYVEGPNLFEATHRANYNQIFSTLAQILRALNYLHRQGLLHGDLKAENILVVKEASLFQEDAVKLIDFGLTKSLDEALRDRGAGSIHFMAPEILLERGADHRADLYALGVCLYRMIAGRYPFEDENIRQLIQSQIEKTPIPPARFRVDLPRGLNELTLQLLSKSPEDRFPSAAAVLEALNELEGENYPLWSESELRLSLREGPLVGRSRERTVLQKGFEKGIRRFFLTGPDGIGKKRLEREFRLELKLAGDSEQTVSFGEGGEPVPVSPLTQAESEFFLKGRLRLEKIPEGWRSFIARMGGIPGKLIQLIEFWLGEGVLRIEGDRACLSDVRSDEQARFEALRERQIKVLQRKKREILELCAFSHVPLSLDLLRRITDLAQEEIELFLGELEKENWLVRVLFNGTFHFRLSNEFLKDLLLSETGLESRPVDVFLRFLEETYRAGRHLEAHTALRRFLRRYQASLSTLPRDHQFHLFGLASLVALETGHLDEARGYCGRLLEIPTPSPLERGKVLNRLGWIAYREGKYGEALQNYRKAEEFWNRTEGREGKVAVANLTGMVFQALRDWEKARFYYRKALSLLEEGDGARAGVRMNLATAAQEEGDYSLALSEYDKALEEAGQSGDRQLLARLLLNVAGLRLFFGRYREAGRLAHKALRIAVENGLWGLQGQAYLLLSVIEDKQGNVEPCGAFLEKAMDVMEWHGSAAEKAQVRLHEAYYRWTRGEGNGALLRIQELRGSFPEEREILIQCDLLEGKIAGGEVLLKRSLAYFEGKGELASVWETAFALGCLKKNPPGAGRLYFQKALDALERLSSRIPPEDRESFFRDRKRERILVEISSEHKEDRTMATQGFSEVARINRLLASEQNLNYLLETILEESLELLEGERGFILLLEANDPKSFRVGVSRNMDRQALEKDEGRYSSTIARQAAVSGHSILVADAKSDERFREAESVLELNIRSAIAVPMKVGPEITGVIYVDNRFQKGSFDEAHQKLLEVFGDQAALAIRNARQVEEIRHRQSEIENLNSLLQKRLDVTQHDLSSIQGKYHLQQEELHLRYAYDHIIGKSERLREVLRILDRVTDSDVTILIMGESGTGKELMARALHYNSPRKDAPFVAVNCSSFSEQLLESELFGHMKGSFTGAIADKQGLFEAADGGTIFLDEIGDMPLGMQSKLLRVLQERQIRPIGGNGLRKANVRVVAATNQNLPQLVKNGQFREDLFYRINVVRVLAPALRERKEDIPLLVSHGLKQQRGETGKSIRVLPKVMELLVQYEWPGNVRELLNEIQKCCAMGVKVISPDLLSEKIREEPSAAQKVAPLDQQVSSVERAVIIEALKKYRYSRIKTAKALGISRITLYKKMKSYGIMARRSDYRSVAA